MAYRTDQPYEDFLKEFADWCFKYRPFESWDKSLGVKPTRRQLLINFQLFHNAFEFGGPDEAKKLLPDAPQ